eukprot:c7230_g1_i1.p1 GENE.c7230_g1_i1~~c7230_g1_i1.p1  ORF type:complete len:302 (+),score=63.12 c7230_g1_i1:85-990(+)
MEDGLDEIRTLRGNTDEVQEARKKPQSLGRLVGHGRPELEDEFKHVGTEIGFVWKEREYKSWNLWRGVMAESIGMIFFLFFTIGTVTSTAGYSAANGLPFDAARHWMISQVFGYMISVLVYGIAPASGGNLNPAVSISLMVTKKITPLRCAIYIVAQCFGATVGCALVKMVDPDRYNMVGGAINSVSADYTPAGAFLAEACCTALLVFTVSSVVDANNGHPERMHMKQSFGVLAIGLCVTMSHAVLIPITNCSINPARSFGASIIRNEWPDHWVFWFAPILGGVLAAFFYEGVLKDTPRRG